MIITGQDLNRATCIINQSFDHCATKADFSFALWRKIGYFANWSLKAQTSENTLLHCEFSDPRAKLVLYLTFLRSLTLRDARCMRYQLISKSSMNPGLYFVWLSCEPVSRRCWYRFLLKRKHTASRTIYRGIQTWTNLLLTLVPKYCWEKLGFYIQTLIVWPTPVYQSEV